MILADRLTHRYRERLALAEVSFEIARGEIFGVLGPNGGGKSTLFRILATLMAPSGGRASIAGFDVARRPGEVRRRSGVVFQSQSLDRALTVEENLRAQGHLHGLAGARLRGQVDGVLDRLGLLDRRRDLVETLSGGLRRRVEIAKALLHRPQVLLMDEASTGLDPRARRELWQYVEQRRASEGVTILLTTHLLDEAERCDRLALLHEGRLVAEGTPAELRARIGGDVVVLEAAEPQALAARVSARFGVRPAVADGALRIELPDGHRFIAEVVEAFPGAIGSAALHKPTLEDVFVHETGAALD